MYKECNLVMRRSNGEATLNSIIYYPVNKTVHRCTEDHLNYINDDDFKLTSKHCYPVHLYVVSDDDNIVTGDWFYVFDHFGGIISVCDNKSRFVAKTSSYIQAHGGKKIIATTDKSLRVPLGKGFLSISDKGIKEDTCSLPDIPETFISKFIIHSNTNEIITKIKVEYKSVQVYPKSGRDFQGNEKYEYVPVTNSENNYSINIKSIKENWTRDEVESLIRKARIDAYEETRSGSNLIDIKKNSDNWITEML